MIIQAGGRPTRPICSEPVLKACEEDAERVFSLSDDEEEAVEHYELLMARHWATEKRRIEAELKRWTTFRNTEQGITIHFPRYPCLRNMIPMESWQMPPRIWMDGENSKHTSIYPWLMQP